MVSFDQTWWAAVVQGPVHGVESDSTARDTQHANARRVARLLDSLASLDPKPSLVVLPVLCLTGSRRHIVGVHMATVASSLDDPLWQPIADACARNQCYVASTLQETVPELPGRFFHTGFVFGPAGLVLRSPKAQAFSAPEVTSLRDIIDDYSAAFGRDAILPVAETPLGRIACLVESELLVPEASRLLARKGAEIIVHPTLERRAQPQPHSAFKQVNAFANGVYWLSAASSRETDLADASRWVWIGGRSQIVGPDGRIDAEVGVDSDGIGLALIDPARLDDARTHQARETTPADELYTSLYG